MVLTEYQDDTGFRYKDYEHNPPIAVAEPIVLVNNNGF